MRSREIFGVTLQVELLEVCESAVGYDKAAHVVHTEVVTAGGTRDVEPPEGREAGMSSCCRWV
jgi:hypothetical protein